MFSKTFLHISISGLCLAALPAQPLSASQVEWQLLASGCGGRPPEGVAELACGEHGTYQLAPPGVLREARCLTLARGFGEPALYPVSSQLDLDVGYFPCRDGACFERRYDRPWVAVVDWSDPHGWSVAETVLQASDRRVDVELYDLAQPPEGALPESLTEIGDAHVLAQLCRLSELAADPAEQPPLAVNLSFGRLPDKDRASCDDPTSSTLSCEIRAVLSHLGKDYGVLAVAAAGNHGRMLFPAEAPGVIDTGALDLSWYAFTGGAAVPSFESPLEAQALVPGYGLVLEGPPPIVPTWQAPAGSSYASALLTGWLTGALAQSDAAPFAGAAPVADVPPVASDDTAGVWQPVRVGGRFALRDDRGQHWGLGLEGPSRIIARALCDAPEDCAGVEMAGGEVLQRVEGVPTVPVNSLITVAAGHHHPLPGVDPCDPCSGDMQQGSMLHGFGGGAEEDLELDLSSSQPLPAEYRLSALYLQVGGSLVAFDRSTSWPLLRDLELGIVEGLKLEGVSGLFGSGQQASLVFVLELVEDDVPFWHSVPLHLDPTP